MIKQYVRRMINVNIFLSGLDLLIIWENLPKSNGWQWSLNNHSNMKQQSSRQKPISSKNRQLFVLLRRF